MKNILKKTHNRIIRNSFKFCERYFQVHLTPLHYYSPIPVTYQLDEKVYAKEFACKGIDWREPAQIAFIKEAAKKYAGEFTPEKNSGLSLVDAFLLYSMLREKKPRVVIEVGSGYTTLISLKALAKNAEEGHGYAFTAIEPYPRPFLKEIRDEHFTLVEKKLQDVPIELFASCDLLFIDSSHVSKIDSDVNYEILEIIPTLKKGCVIHWHDIALPYNYKKEWVQHGNMFFNESYLVHAFMLFNTSFAILCASRYLQTKHAGLMKAAFPYLTDEHYLSSFWIQRVS